MWSRDSSRSDQDDSNLGTFGNLCRTFIRPTRASNNETRPPRRHFVTYNDHDDHLVYALPRRRDEEHERRSSNRVNRVEYRTNCILCKNTLQNHSQKMCLECQISISSLVRCHSPASMHELDEELNRSTSSLDSDSSADSSTNELNACSTCQDPIAIFRYKCLQCVDVNLCISCEKNDKHHPGHYLLRFPNKFKPTCDDDILASLLSEKIDIRKYCETQEEVLGSIPLEPDVITCPDELAAEASTAHQKISGWPTLCSVCFRKYSSTVSPASILCGHILCTTCIKKILKYKSKCPTCRNDVVGYIKLYP